MILQSVVLQSVMIQLVMIQSVMIQLVVLQSSNAYPYCPMSNTSRTDCSSDGATLSDIVTAPSLVTSIQFLDYADGECSGVDNVITFNLGYYQSWSVFRGCNPVAPSAIDIVGNGYTHLKYAFAFISANFQLEPWGGDSDAEEQQSVQSLQRSLKSHSRLKTLIAIGGWTYNNPGETQTRFSDTASTP